MRSLLLHLPNSLCLRLVSDGRAVVNAIVSATNGALDRVVIGCDFNAIPDNETVKVLESMGYKRHAEDWLDYIHVHSRKWFGLRSTPQTTIIRDTGSDHRGIKTIWSSLYIG